jgi:indole-3-acetate monooxygenase
VLADHAQESVGGNDFDLTMARRNGSSARPLQPTLSDGDPRPGITVVTIQRFFVIARQHPTGSRPCSGAVILFATPTAWEAFMVATTVQPARNSAATAEPKPPTGNAQLLTAVRVLAPALAARAEEIENGCRLPDDIVDALAELGVVRMMLPRSHGGFEFSVPDVLPVLEALSAADASVGWVAMAWVTNLFFCSRLPRALYDQIYGNGFAPVMIGVGTPAGRAEKIDGGYRVSGRWPFASGCQNAQWIIAHCVVWEDGKPVMAGNAPVTRFVLVPAERWRIEETWQASGLSGTGSHHIVLDNEEVPETHSCDIFHGPSCLPGPSEAPVMPFMPIFHAAVAVGIAAGAVADLVSMANAGRQQLFASTALRDSTIFQHELGQIGAELRAARALMEVQAASHWRRAIDGILDDTADFTESLQANAWIHTACTNIVGRCYTLGGSAVVLNTSPLQRRLRDIHAAKQHLSAQERVYAGAGALHLGFPPLSPIARL